MNLKKINLLLCLWCVSFVMAAQSKQIPEIGKPFPEVVFQNVKNYHTKSFDVKAHKGKWLFLDFWSLGCTACFTSFKKIKEIEKVHSDKVQFLLVGKKDHDYNSDIERIYDRINANMKLRAPVVYDSVLRNTWGIESFPYIYIIDPGGILRFITGGRDVTAPSVLALLNNEPVSFGAGFLESPESFDVSTFTQNDRVLTTTIISESNGEKVFADVNLEMINELDPATRHEGWKVARVPLTFLYNEAYWGKGSWTRSDSERYANIFPYPLLEMKDTSLFASDYTVRPPQGAYNCFIKLPSGKNDSQSYMKELQLELEKAFGYKATIETRTIQVWSLEVTPEGAKKLRTKNGVPFFTPGSGAGGFVLRNQSTREMIGWLIAHLLFDKRIIFVDNTGIEGNIDLTIDGDMTDFNVVRKEMARHGLSFVKRSKQMKVLILRD